MMVPDFWLNHLLHSVGTSQPEQTNFAKTHHEASNVEDPHALDERNEDEADADEKRRCGKHDADVGLSEQVADERRRESFGQVEHRDVQRPLSGRNAQQIGDVGLESTPRREDESRASEGDHDARDNDEDVTHAHLIGVGCSFAQFLSSL